MVTIVGFTSRAAVLAVPSPQLLSEIGFTTWTAGAFWTCWAMISVPKAIHESIIHLHGVARIVSIQINLEIQNSNLRDPSEMVFRDQQYFSQFLAGRFTALVKFQNASLERSHRMKSMEKTWKNDEFPTHCCAPEMEYESQTRATSTSAH